MLRLSAVSCVRERSCIDYWTYSVSIRYWYWCLWSKCLCK